MGVVSCNPPPAKSECLSYGCPSPQEDSGTHERHKPTAVWRTKSLGHMAMASGRSLSPNPMTAGGHGQDHQSISSGGATEGLSCSPTTTHNSQATTAQRMVVAATPSNQPLASTRSQSKIFRTYGRPASRSFSTSRRSGTMGEIWICIHGIH